MGYRGEDWIGVDSDGLGDGVDHAQTADTGLQQRLWGNSMFQAGNPRLICWSPLIDGANVMGGAGNVDRAIRPYALVNHWLTVWTGEIVIEPGDKGVELFIVGHVHDIEPETGSPGAMRLRIIVDGLGRREDLVMADSFNVANEDTARYRFQLEFDELYKGDSAQTFLFEIAVKGEVMGSLAATTATASWGDFNIKDDTLSGGGVYFVDSATGPDPASLEATVIEMTDGNGRAQYINLLGGDDYSAKEPDDNSQAWTVEKLPQSLSGRTIAKYSSMYFSPRCMAVRMLRDKESAGSLAKGAFAPNITFKSSPVIRQVRAARKLARQRRLVAFGPRDGGDSVATSPRFFANAYDTIGYRMCWPFIMGDTDGSMDPILQETFMMTTENSAHMELVCWVMVLSLESQFNSTGLIKHLGKKKIIKDDDSIDPGRTKWEFRARVDQINDQAATVASWTNPAHTTTHGDSTQTEQFPTHGCWLTADEPMRRGQELNWLRQSGGSGFWHKEGSVIPGENDYPFLQPINMRINLSGVTEPISQRPFRLSIFADHQDKDDVTVNDYFRDAGDGLSGPSARVRFVLGHYALYEVPLNG